MAETWVQLGFQVLPGTGTTIHRLVENPIPLERLATLWEFTLAIMPVPGTQLRETPHCVQASNSDQNHAVRGRHLEFCSVPVGALLLPMPNAGLR